MVISQVIANKKYNHELICGKKYMRQEIEF